MFIYLNTRTHFYRRLRLLPIFHVPDQPVLHPLPGARGAGPLAELLARLRRRRRAPRIVVLLGDGLCHQAKRRASLQDEEERQATANADHMSQNSQQQEVETRRAEGVVSVVA